MEPSAPSDRVGVTPAQLESYHRLVEHAFAFGLDAEGWARFVSGFGAENVRLREQDGRLCAGLGFYRMGHYFGGRAVPAAGIAAVASPPDARGQGHVATLLSETLQALAEEGFGLSSLFASTQGPYRKVGYEEAGVRCKFSLPSHLTRIRGDDSGARIEEVPESERASLREVYEAYARRNQGMLVRSEGLWMRVLTPHPGAAPLTYRVREGDRITGYIVYQQLRSGLGFEAVVRDRAYLTAAAGRALWQLLWGQRSMLERVHWFGAVPDPWTQLLPESQHLPSALYTWMLRMLDLKVAFETRGYPAGVSARLDLEVDDPGIPANSGRWRLEVAEGRGALSSGGDGGLRLGPQGLASLYTGYASARELQVAGLLDGDDAALARASQIFAGPRPWMTEMF